MIFFLRLLIRILVPFLRRTHRRWRQGLPIECLVVGYGGANNTGAEARTAEAIDQMLAADDRLHISFTSLDRRSTLRYLTENERLSVVGINPVFVFCMARLVARSDMVVLAEGSCFKENFSPVLLWFFMYAAELAERLGLPVIAYGVDAGPLSKPNARWAREVAERMDLLMTRTAAAKERLREIEVEREVEVTADTAFTLVPASAEWAGAVLAGGGVDLERPLVGIAFEEFFWWPVVASPLKALFGVKADRYRSIYYHSWGVDGRRRSAAMKDAVAAFANWVEQEYGAGVILFAMESLDAGPCRDVANIIGRKIPIFDADHASASQMAALLRRLDLLVTCRYHALVLSMGGYVPVIGVGHDERIETIMEELGLLRDYFISHQEELIFDRLRDATRRIMSERDSIRARIESALPSYFERMAENGRLFSRVVRENFPIKP